MVKLTSYNYLIRNLRCNNHLLVYNTVNRRFDYKNKDKLNNKLISNFNVKFIKENSYKLNYREFNIEKSLSVILIYSSNKIDHPLFFNIVIKQDNVYKILYIKNTKLDVDMDCKNKVLTYKILDGIDNVKNILFNDTPQYIFYFITKKLELCRIKLNKNSYSLYGYNKLPTINKKIKGNQYCFHNPELNNSWKVNTTLKPSCKLLNFKKGNIADIKTKLNNCSNNNYRRLLRKLLNNDEISELYKKNMKTYIAGKIQNKIEQNQKKIEEKLGDTEIKELYNDVENNLDEENKSILADSLTNFNRYIGTGVSDLVKARTQYKNLLNIVKERQKEYSLASKSAICNGKLIKKLYKINNFIDCQGHCNMDQKCTNISYNRVEKKCNLYESCKLLFNNTFDTYTKKSRLRQQGYNLYEALQRQKNPPISKVPLEIEVIYYIACIMIIFCGGYVLLRILEHIYVFTYYSVYKKE